MRTRLRNITKADQSGKKIVFFIRRDFLFIIIGTALMSVLNRQLIDKDTTLGDQMKGKRCKKFSKVLEFEGVELLLHGEEKVPVSSIEGKFICLYFSAEWCRPCKSFTPQLVQLYDKLKKRGEKLEIVFISFDRNKQGFDKHLKCMPWFAVPFEVNLHRRIIDHYKVDHIPSFLPLDLDRKLLVENDVVAMIEDYGVDAFPFTKERFEELKVLDNEKSRGGKIEKLLAYEGRKNLISGNGKEVHVSDLAGKTIALYFGAHWCPPCQVFTSQLKQVYNELCNTSNQCFEIVFVSTDRDTKEFNLHLNMMPWLAIPFEDKTRQDLCRVFQVKRIPSLVLIGPDGNIISTNGRGMILLYRAKGFPFTQKRIEELEEELRKDGEGLACNVKDPKHEHVLKLDMAKAYVCDFCKSKGDFGHTHVMYVIMTFTLLV